MGFAVMSSNYFHHLIQTTNCESQKLFTKPSAGIWYFFDKLFQQTLYKEHCFWKYLYAEMESA